MLERLIFRNSPASQLETEIAELRAENESLKAELARVRSGMEAAVSLGENLKRQLAELKARLGTNSHNSSKPPSSDGPRAKPRAKPAKRSGRKPGGQAGHPGTTRALVEVDAAHTHEVVPEQCEACQTELNGRDPNPERRQIIDIPEPTLITDEYRLHELECAQCGHRTRAKMPAGKAVGASPFGPGLHAMVGLWVGRFKQGKRPIVELLAVLYTLKISVGTVSAMERRLSAALAAPVAEAQTHIQGRAVIHMDETSWREQLSKAWLWLAATPDLAVFRIDRRRGGDIVKTMLGDFAGVLCVDRWSAYSGRLRQACWAHLLRDFVAMSERHNSPWHGNRLACIARSLMALAADHQAGTIDRPTFIARAQTLRTRMAETLKWTAQNAPGPKARAMAKELLKVEPMLWTFLEYQNVPLTNNHAERLLRYPVIWRKLSFGTRSEAGSLYVERLLTVTMSLRLQDRNVFHYLKEAVIAHSCGQVVPSILPEPLMA